MRLDIHVPNESDAFVFTSAAVRGRGLMPGEAEWTAAALARDLLPLLVESEDPANVRVVVDESLSDDEQAQWVGRVQGALCIHDGKLALCGGAAYVIDKEEWAADYARIVDVPAGDYRATVYCYASAPNGRLCLEQAGDEEPLGTWFRRSYPDREMPVWLHNRCVNDADNDPKHRAQWKRAKEKPGGLVIDFLLHLETMPGAAPTPILDHGFAEAGDCRKPETFPLGLTAQGLVGIDDSDRDEDSDEEVPSPTEGPSSSTGFDPVPIGGAVDVPVTKLVRAARLAWLCHPYTLPSLTITLATAKGVPNLEEIEGINVRRDGSALQIQFDDNGQVAGAQDAMIAIGKQLGALPDGARIALDFSRRGRQLGARPVGLLRFRGGIAGGNWRIDATFPPMSADVLQQALTVAESLEIPRRFIARDDEEARRIEERVMKHAPEFFQSNPLQRNGAELTLRRDPAAMWQIAAQAIRLRYEGVLPAEPVENV